MLYAFYFFLAVAALMGLIAFGIKPKANRGLAKSFFWIAVAAAFVFGFIWFFTQSPGATG